MNWEWKYWELEIDEDGDIICSTKWAKEWRCLSEICSLGYNQLSEELYRDIDLAPTKKHPEYALREFWKRMFE